VGIHTSSRPAATSDLARLPWGRLAGVRVGIVLWGGLAVVDVGGLAGASSYTEVAGLALLVTLASIGVSTATALCAAGVGWLVDNGFVVHSLGVLGYESVSDTLRPALLVVLAVAASRVPR
jgi:hypothetical protein